MTLPTGSGSEFLNNHVMIGTTSADTFAPAANHIYTILNFAVHNNHSSSTNFQVALSRNNGSNYGKLLDAQTLQVNETFVWSDKIVLYNSTSIIRFTPNGSDPLDIWINYIDQDWT